MMRNREHQNLVRQTIGSLYDAVTDTFWMLMMLIADQHQQQITAPDEYDDFAAFDYDDDPEHADNDAPDDPECYDPYYDDHHHSPYFSDDFDGSYSTEI